MRAALPPALRTVSHRLRSSQAQWFFDDPRIHFEAWWHAQTGRLEIGLHLEAETEVNDRIAARLAHHLFEVKARLGSQFDLEPWDRGWVRLYETHPMDGFDAAAVSRSAARIAEVISVLWPLYLEVSHRMAGRGRPEGRRAR